jgi:integrase/recombinase XerD
MTASVSLRKGEKLPEILTEDEQTAFLSVPKLRYPTAVRNYSLILIMLDCGLRSSEIVNLQIGDVDLKTGKVVVRIGKGGKDRQLWAAERTLDAVRRWVERRAKPSIDCGYLYSTLEGKQLDTSYLRHMCARYGKRAGIEKRIHPHMLRHSFATDLYRQTKDIRMVQKALGHSDLSSTMIYTHLVDEELENGMKALRRT